MQIAKEHIFARYYRGPRVPEIHEGTSEMQRLAVARTLLEG